MTFALALVLSSLSPRTIAQATPPPPQTAPMPACPPPRRFTAVAIDPVPPIDVNVTQHFIVAMRVVADAGYQWELVDAPDKLTSVRGEGSQLLSDVALQNLDRKPDTPPAVGGAATQLFLFTATAPGSATLNFGLLRPGGTTPTRTVTYTVRVSPNVAVC
ncbi:MAG TPA: protease inhibitor I42 family protein [Candidatus Elarobacter sp.]|jgi:hypothetical protein|nr:protease inhibitor I42 family protein [Candidatus Elarobacter sp.]